MSMLRRVLDREAIVKNSLVESLIECVKELQLRDAGERKQTMVNDETTNTLCWILEAVFIHGLKSHFLKSVSSALSASRGFSNEPQLPEPSFWEFILVFCHHEVIIQINKLNLIRTDIGRCRTWLRLALNDGLLISYLQLILSDKATVKDYYKPNAFLRDTEKCDILKSYLYGIESYEFQLACNSSLLNAWNPQPLSMVGLWVQIDSTISQGVDVAENMDSKDLQALPQLRKSTPPKPSFFDTRVPLLEEDEALRVILSSRGSGSPSVQLSSTSASSSRRNSDSSYTHISLPNSTLPISSTRLALPSRGNGTLQNTKQIQNVKPSLAEETPTKTEVTSSEQQKGRDMYQKKLTEEPLTEKQTSETDGSEKQELYAGSKENVDAEVEIQTDEGRHIGNSSSAPVTIQHQNSVTGSLLASTEEEYSYAALFRSYNRDTVIGTPITIGSYMESQLGASAYGGGNAISNETSTSSETDPALGSSLEDTLSNSITAMDNLDFEILSEFPSDGVSDMMSQISTYSKRIPVEVGIDVQNYKCRTCEQQIGMIYGPARLCGLTGFYYCSTCHVNDEAVIPSRILLNWDFGRYNVCKQAKEFLEGIMDEPLFDLNKINEKLYREVEECGELHTIRTKLQSISIYLRTCKEPIMHEFKKEIWPKDYFYEAFHSYSLSDLLNIPNRCLRGSLSKLFLLGKNHITSCVFCKLKGFVCEVCRNSEVIFPFDLELIYKCSSCGAVYHNTCMNNMKTCPRCERWKSVHMMLI